MMIIIIIMMIIHLFQIHHHSFNLRTTVLPLHSIPGIYSGHPFVQRFWIYLLHYGITLYWKDPS
jgi:hypothetical protein